MTSTASCRRAQNAKAGRPEGPPALEVRRGLLDRAADAAELARSVLAEHGDSGDADHGDQGHEQGVLHEGGTTLGVAETSPHPVGDEFVREDHPIVLLSW